LAVTAGVRELADDPSQAAAKRLGEIGAIPTWNAIGGLGCPFATLTVFVRKRKKAGASDAIVRRIVNDSPHQRLAGVRKIKRKDPCQGSLRKDLFGGRDLSI
jgi:hypothetical protein